MTERARAPWIVWGIVVTLLLVTLTLAFRNGSVSGDALTIAVSIVMMLGYLTTGAVVASREQVTVGIHRHDDRRMSEPLLHDLRVDARLQRERGPGVAQSVNG